MIIPTGFSQISLIFGGAGLPTGGAVVYGVENTDDQPPVDICLLARDLWDENIRPDVSSGVVLQKVQVKNGPNTTGGFAEITSSLAGGATGAACTPQVAILVKKVTGIGGRQNRGRLYHPGVLEAAVNNDGFLVPANLATLQTDYSNWWDAHGLGSNIPMVLLHAPGGSSDDTPTAIETLTVQAQVGTQRRRNRR